MASRSLGQLTLDLVARTGGFVNGMSKAQRESEKFKRKLAADAKAAGRAMGIGLAAGAVAATAGLSVMVSRSLDAIDAQAKMAQRLRTSYESLSALARAGELAGVSLSQIEVASRTLDVNLGKASQGIGAQADALEKLKLNADDIAALPLDERIIAINNALAENVSETERAAIAADLFGTRSAAAIQMLDPDTIAEAARQMELFGLNLSDVDAAKVEQANDAISTFGLLSDGVGKQLTVELAPILKAIGDEFLRSAEEAGGLSVQVQDSVRSIISALAFVVNAADGVKRAFIIAADGAILAISGIAAGAAENVADLLSVISYVPGIDFSDAEASVREFSATQQAVFSEAADNIQRTLMEPLAGDALVAFYDRAQAAGQAAAEATVAGRQNQAVYNDELDETVDKLGKIEVFAKKRELPDSIKEMIDLQRDYNSLVRDLQTDEERLQEQLNGRLALLEKVSFISEDARATQVGRAVAAAFPEAPEYGGLAPEIGGPFGELAKIDDARADLESWYSDQLSMLSQFREQHQELNAQWDEQELELRQQHADRLREIDQAREVATLAATEDLFGNLAGLTREFAGEQSAAYKALFAIEKAAAIASAVVNVQGAIAKAANSGPFPANLAAMGTVAAATAGLVTTIASTSIAGQAHAGMMNVPEDGTYILKQGERVVSAETTAKLDSTLNDIKDNRASPQQQPLRIVNLVDSEAVGQEWSGSSSFERSVMNVVTRNRRTVRNL